MKPGTQYEARLGTLTVDDPSPDEDSIPSAKLAALLPNPRIWWDELHKLPEELSLATFTTFPSHNTSASNLLTFLVGSCRYPGILWQAKHSDAIFGSLLEEARGRDARRRAEFVLMVGDQIYADTLHRGIPMGRADTEQEFQDRYNDAFGSRSDAQAPPICPHLHDSRRPRDRGQLDKGSHLKGGKTLAL